MTQIARQGPVTVTIIEAKPDLFVRHERRSELMSEIGENQRDAVIAQANAERDARIAEASARERSEKASAEARAGAMRTAVRWLVGGPIAGILLGLVLGKAAGMDGWSLAFLAACIGGVGTGLVLALRRAVLAQLTGSLTQ